MKQLEYASFSRKISLRNARDSFLERRGFYLRFKNGESDSWHFGEAAPLPGFSKESLEDCQRQLLERKNRDSLLETICSGAGGERFLPALRFALESIHYSFSAKESHNSLRLSFLVPGFPDLTEQRRAGLEAIAAGFRVLKLKISPAVFGDINALLNEFRESCAEKLYFRLDANLSLNHELLASLESRMSKENLDCIEYLEDPYLNVSAQRYRLPIAIEQAARNLEFTTIVKPMVHGSLANLVGELAEAKKKGTKLILSSSLETEIGLKAIRNFARRYADLDFAHGLATAGILTATDMSDKPILSVDERLGKNSLARLAALHWEAL